jgi:hypothetical protein
MFKTYLEPLPYGQVGHTARVAFALPGNNGHQLAHSRSGRCCQYGHRLLAVGLGLADTPKANHGLVHIYSQFLFLSNGVIHEASALSIVCAVTLARAR